MVFCGNTGELHPRTAASMLAIGALTSLRVREYQCRLFQASLTLLWHTLCDVYHYHLQEPAEQLYMQHSWLKGTIFWHYGWISHIHPFGIILNFSLCWRPHIHAPTHRLQPSYTRVLAHFMTSDQLLWCNQLRTLWPVINKYGAINCALYDQWSPTMVQSMRTLWPVIYAHFMTSDHQL